MSVTIGALAEEVCTATFGFTTWSKDHEDLYRHLCEVMRRYRQDIYDDTDPINLLE